MSTLLLAVGALVLAVVVSALLDPRPSRPKGVGDRGVDVMTYAYGPESGRLRRSG